MVLLQAWSAPGLYCCIIFYDEGMGRQSLYFRLLLALPPPWCVKSRIEDINIILSFARDIQFSQRRPFLSSTAFEQRILTSVAFQPVSGWVLTLPFLHPAIVINLDRRSDR